MPATVTSSGLGAGNGVAQAYARAAAAAGDPVRLEFIAGVGHFEIASPRASTWPRVAAAIRALLDGRLPPAAPGDAARRR
jgi:hypothetical protein